MIQNRLEQFFNLKPIVALDPDLAVARGASIYHYYLHKNEALQEDMRKVGLTSNGKNDISYTKKEMPTTQNAIEWGSNILNDSLYLGLKNNNVEEIIKTGTELPFTSKLYTGYFLPQGSNKISLPIKTKNLKNEYQTIALGEIAFNKNYPKGAYLAFSLSMDTNKVIKMESWVCKDSEGNEKLEKGGTTIAIFNKDNTSINSKKIISAIGNEIDIKATMHNLEQLSKKCDLNPSLIKTPNKVTKDIDLNIKSICNAKNKEEAIDLVLDGILSSNNAFAGYCLSIARKICQTADESVKNKLKRNCMTILAIPLNGFAFKKSDTNLIIQAIYTLSMCGKKEDIEKLEVLRNDSKLIKACLLAYSKNRLDTDWIYSVFNKECNNLLKNNNRQNIASCISAMALALRYEGAVLNKQYKIYQKKVIKSLYEIVNNNLLENEDLLSCVLAAAFICDQRQGNHIDDLILDQARGIISFIKSKGVINMIGMSMAEKMIDGVILSSEEEKYLLSKV